MKTISRIAAGALLAAVLAAPPVGAQTAYPEKTVRFVAGFAPGGPADIVARLMGQALSEKWGKPVVVENRGGAGGNIAAVAVSRADPDGYTVLVTTTAIAANVSYYEDAGYALSDYKTAALVGTAPNIIVGAPNLAANNLAEAMTLAKTQPLSFASAGAGTTPHLSGERIFRLLGKVDVRHVPFTGAGPAISAVMAGHVPLSSVALSGAIEQVKGGTVKGLAVTSAKRIADLPDVPTVTEAGLGEVDDATWVGLFVHAKTPGAVLARINADSNAVLASPKVREGLAKAGLIPMGGDLATSQAYVEAEAKKWAEVVNALGLKAPK